MRRTKTPQQRLELGLWRMSNDQLIHVSEMDDEHLHNACAMLERIISEAPRHGYCVVCRVVEGECRKREFCAERSRPIMREWVNTFRREMVERSAKRPRVTPGGCGHDTSCFNWDPEEEP